MPGKNKQVGQGKGLGRTLRSGVQYTTKSPAARQKHTLLLLLQRGLIHLLFMHRTEHLKLLTREVLYRNVLCGKQIVCVKVGTYCTCQDTQQVERTTFPNGLCHVCAPSARAFVRVSVKWNAPTRSANKSALWLLSLRPRRSVIQKRFLAYPSSSVTSLEHIMCPQPVRQRRHIYL